MKRTIRIPTAVAALLAAPAALAQEGGTGYSISTGGWISMLGVVVIVVVLYNVHKRLG